jgi:hypothetical protein
MKVNIRFISNTPSSDSAQSVACFHHTAQLLLRVKLSSPHFYSSNTISSSLIIISTTGGMKDLDNPTKYEHGVLPDDNHIKTA